MCQSAIKPLSSMPVTHRGLRNEAVKCMQLSSTTSLTIQLFDFYIASLFKYLRNHMDLLLKMAIC